MIHMNVKEIRITEFVSLLTVLESLIEVKQKHFLIKIIGNELRILSMNEDEIVCCGKIKEVLFL